MKISNWIITIGLALGTSSVTGNNYLALIGPPPLRFRAEPHQRSRVLSSLPKLRLNDDAAEAIAPPSAETAEADAPSAKATEPNSVTNLLAGIGLPPAFVTNTLPDSSVPLLAPDLNGMGPGQFTPQMIVPFLQPAGGSNAQPAVLLPPRFVPPSGMGVLPSRAIYTRSPAKSTP